MKSLKMIPMIMGSPTTAQLGHSSKNLELLRPTLKGVWFFLLFFLLLYPTFLLAADVSVEASLDSKSFPIDQSAVLTLTIQGSNSGHPEMPHGKGLQFSYQSQSSQMQWINGSSSSSLTLIFRVRGIQPGEHTIEPIKVTVDGKQYSTKPIQCTVLPASSSRSGSSSVHKGGQAVQPPPPTTRLRSGEADKVGFMRILPAKRTIFVGERLPITIKVLLRQGIRWEGLSSAPRLADENFILEYIDEKPIQTQEVVNGIPYTLVTWKGTLSAIKQGTFPIEVEIDATLLEQTQRQGASRFGASPFNDPFFASFFGGFNRKNITLVSPKKSITVKGLPEAGKPADFRGAIGSFSLGVSAGPTKVQVGDPITLKMRIQGTGNFDRVHAPVFPDTTAWKTYDPSTDTENSGNENAPESIHTKVFEQAIIPVHSQVQEIPSLRFSYFDPKQGHYITLNSDPIPVIVQGDATLASSVQAPVVPSVPTTKNNSATGTKPALAPIHPQYGSTVAATTLKPLYLKTWFLLLIGLGITILATSIFLLIRKNRRAADPVKYQKQALLEELGALIAQAKTAIQANDSKQFFALCRLILQKRFGFSWQVEPQAICAADLERTLPKDAPITDIFRQAEHAIYTGQQISEEKMNSFLTTIQEDIKTI